MIEELLATVKRIKTNQIETKKDHLHRWSFLTLYNVLT
tara:strand:+ start:2230 stop:2343 length:114 start_codon:yes stop_codon:yes gene_type:complete